MRQQRVERCERIEADLEAILIGEGWGIHPFNLQGKNAVVHGANTGLVHT